MFQANEELNVSGDVDNDTYTKMQQTDRKFSALKKGMNGNAVKVMQTYLAKLGYNVGTVDGRYLFLINAKTEAQSFYLPNGRWKKIAEIGNRVIQQCDVSGVAFEVFDKCV